MESHELYRAARSQLIAICRGLTTTEASTPVAACPGWTVADVLAHVTGIASDVLDGNVDGIGTEDWTDRQVVSRRGRTLGDVLDEYAELGGALDAAGIANPARAMRMARDATVHEHDVRAALDRPGDRSAETVSVVCQSYAEGFIDRVLAAGLADVAVKTERWRVGAPDAPVSVSGDAFELLRCLTGRRSRRHAEALAWSGDHRAHVALIPTYGDFQIMDVIE